MGGNDNDKWFVAGGRSRARKRQDASTSRGCTRKAVYVGGGTSRGGAKKCYNCRDVGHLQHQCPSRVGATSSRGKQTSGGHYGFSSNVNTTASNSTGGKNRKPLAPKQQPKVGPSRRGGQPGSMAVSTSRATTAGHMRVRDPTTTSGFIPPNKQATGSTRFSYAAAVKGGQ